MALNGRLAEPDAEQRCDRNQCQHNIDEDQQRRVHASCIGHWRRRPGIEMAPHPRAEKAWSRIMPPVPFPLCILSISFRLGETGETPETNSSDGTLGGNGEVVLWFEAAGKRGAGSLACPAHRHNEADLSLLVNFFVDLWAVLAWAAQEVRGRSLRRSMLSGRYLRHRREH